MADEVNSNKDVVPPSGNGSEGRGAWYKEASRERVNKLGDRFSSWADSYLGKSVTGSGKLSWGLVILGLVAVYAIIRLARSIMYFFG